jgi:hypothetical protein
MTAVPATSVRVTMAPRVRLLLDEEPNAARANRRQIID